MVADVAGWLLFGYFGLIVACGAVAAVRDWLWARSYRRLCMSIKRRRRKILPRYVMARPDEY